MSQICRIVEKTKPNADSISALYLLYYPLMSKDACIVYEILQCFKMQTIEQNILLQSVQMSNQRFIRARKFLEQYHLLKTFFSKEKSSWIYYLYAPLSPSAFLAHDTFSRLLLNHIGSRKFDQLKTFFSNDEEIDATFKDVSEKTDISPLDNWTSEKEQTFLQMRPNEKPWIQYHFDFDRFFKGMDRIIPYRLRTKENLTRIAQMADVQGVDAETMQKYVIRSLNFEKNAINFDHLKSLVYKNHTSIEKTPDRYQQSPVQFMVFCQHGAPVAYTDRILIDELANTYHFPNEVINVLIEYVLQQTGQKFPKSYVEKVAGTWARLQIDTKDKALVQVQGTNNNQKQSKSTWYDEVDTEKADDALINEMIARQKKMRGE